MFDRLPNEIRVLAVDPSPQGLGFVVFEGPEALVDWGTKRVEGDKNAACVQVVRKLIDRYRPQVLALEDAADDDSHRDQRVLELLNELRAVAREKRVRAAPLSRARVQAAFRPRKDVIAAAIAGRFPELADRLPALRKAGDSEHAAMPVFDAAALASTYFHFRSEPA